MKTNIKQYVRLSESPFKVYIEDHILEVWDGDRIVVDYYLGENFDSDDFIDAIERILSWLFSPQEMNTNEVQILESLWQQGYRFVRKAWEFNEEGYIQITATKSKFDDLDGDDDFKHELYYFEEGDNVFPTLDFGWYSIAELLKKR